MKGERSQQARVEFDVHFNSEEIEVLQGLVNGLTKREFEKVFSIPPLVLARIEADIADRLGGKTRRNGLYQAVVEAIKQNKLDTDKLPSHPQESFSSEDINILAMMYRGEGESDWNFRRLEQVVCRKIGVRTSYMAVAWATRELIRRKK